MLKKADSPVWKYVKERLDGRGTPDIHLIKRYGLAQTNERTKTLQLYNIRLVFGSRVPVLNNESLEGVL